VGPSYTSGAALSGVIGRTDYAFELKNDSLSSRPSGWTCADAVAAPDLQRPPGYRPDESWYFRISASTGSYLSATATLKPGDDLSEYRERVWAQDIGFAWHHLQFWPRPSKRATRSPRWATPGPWLITWRRNTSSPRSFPARCAGTSSSTAICRTATAAGCPGPGHVADRRRADYRFTPHTELKLQYSLQFGGIGPRNYSHLTAAQFIIRF